MSKNINKIPLTRVWNALCKLPFGKTIFSKGLGFYIPYTGTIKPKVIRCGGGSAAVKIKQRRGLANHIGSVHAAALANVVELTAGLAFFSRSDCPSCIVTNLSTQYKKLATGTLEAVCSTRHLTLSKTVSAKVYVYNSDRKLVAEGVCTWTLL